jgi:hypothetical protein
MHRRLGLRILGWSIAALAMAACGRRSPPPDDPPPSPAPAPAPAARKAAPPREPDHPETWRASDSPCPIEMTAVAAPKPGETLGEAAIAQGRSPSQINSTIVKTFPSGWTPSPGGEDVPVVYVEASRTEPALSEDRQTFRAGSSSGTAYIFSRAANKFVCMATVHATSSHVVTTLSQKDDAATAWLLMDLQAAIEREVASNARLIDASGAAAPSVALSPTLDTHFHVRVLLPPGSRMEEFPVSHIYSAKVQGADIGVMIKELHSGVRSLDDAVRESRPSEDHVVEDKRELAPGRFYVRTNASGVVHHVNVFFGNLQVNCQSTGADVVALLDKMCLSAAVTAAAPAPPRHRGGRSAHRALRCRRVARR